MHTLDTGLHLVEHSINQMLFGKLDFQKSTLSTLIIYYLVRVRISMRVHACVHASVRIFAFKRLNIFIQVTFPTLNKVGTQVKNIKHCEFYGT